MANPPARAASRNWNLPNLLTYGRVVAVPLVVAFLFWSDQAWARWTAHQCKKLFQAKPMPELASRAWVPEFVPSVAQAAFDGGDGAEIAGPFIVITKH